MFSPIRTTNNSSHTNNTGNSNTSHSSTTPVVLRRSPAPKRCLDVDLTELPSTSKYGLLWDTLVEDLPYAASGCESEEDEEEEDIKTVRSVRCESNPNSNMMSPVSWMASANSRNNNDNNDINGRKRQPLSAIKTRG
jgi:hypothetical protein